MVRILAIDSSAPLDKGGNAENIRVAQGAVRAGELVAFPTETVYGIAARWDDTAAVEKLNAAKLRSPDKPYTLLFGDLDAVKPHLAAAPETALRLAERFWPGPLTLVLPVAAGILNDLPKEARGLYGYEEKIGLRVAASALVEAFFRKLPGRCAWTPSANISGKPPAHKVSDFLDDLAEDLAAVIDAGAAAGGIASTVVLAAGDEVRILREGAFPSDKILAVANG